MKLVISACWVQMLNTKMASNEERKKHALSFILLKMLVETCITITKVREGLFQVGTKQKFDVPISNVFAIGRDIWLPNARK